MSIISLTVVQNSKEYHLEAPQGEPVSKLLRDHGLQHQPCGGAGVCGKCLIFAETLPTEEEVKRLSKHALDSGMRLACYTPAQEGLTIRIPEQDTIQVLTSYSATNYDYQPLVEVRPFEIIESTLENQKTDLNNVLDSCCVSHHSLSLNQLAELPTYLRRQQKGYGLIHNDTLIGVTKCSDNFLLSIDIGTTTVAATLFDINSRSVIKSMGEKNGQSPFGADVITRIQHTISEGQKGIKQLQDIIVQQINSLKNTLIKEVQQSGGTLTDVTMITVTGNTSMIHFLCGFPAEHISKAPFISVTLEKMQLRCSEIGIDSEAPLFIMPGISAYVGADIVSALLAANVHKDKTPFLLIDFGTNAEIVLSKGDSIYSCSTAAGPCFEGATLSCGSMARPGAIDTVFPVDTGFSFTTIGGIKANGLCGSAVIDCIALLLDSGDLDDTGRMEGEGKLAEYIVERDGKKVFILTDDVYLSQEDVRKIQLAKAAVRAGAETLIEESGLSPDSFTKLYLAGGFGSALNPESAVRVGLVPESMAGVIRVLGNGAGYGAMRYATEKDSFEIVEDIKNRTRYIELSAHLKFNELYIDHMYFPELESTKLCVAL
jgi:uncharacterized 2Fe-2S/4Fe-4S cluster protein (DUF4445 family)